MSLWNQSWITYSRELQVNCNIMEQAISHWDIYWDILLTVQILPHLSIQPLLHLMSWETHAMCPSMEKNFQWEMFDRRGAVWRVIHLKLKYLIVSLYMNTIFGFDNELFSSKIGMIIQWFHDEMICIWRRNNLMHEKHWFRFVSDSPRNRKIKILE